MWTEFYWKTRILTEKEIKTGVVVIAFEASDGDVYRAPESKDEAIQNNCWPKADFHDGLAPPFHHRGSAAVPE
jgi:hypothetical protein